MKELSWLWQASKVCYAGDRVTYQEVSVSGEMVVAEVMYQQRVILGWRLHSPR
ncbi:hypothetical protein ACT691_19865 [Vibrio metschnikovii]